MPLQMTNQCIQNQRQPIADHCRLYQIISNNILFFIYFHRKQYIMDRQQRNRFKPNNNAAQGKNEKAAGSSSRNQNNADASNQIMSPRHNQQQMPSQNMQSKGPQSPYGKQNGAAVRTIPKRHVKYNNNAAPSSLSPQKKKNEATLQDQHVQVMKTNQFQQQRHNLPTQHLPESKQQSKISALDFSLEQAEPELPIFKSVNPLQNAFADDDDLDGQASGSSQRAALKKQRRLEKFQRRLQVLKQREIMQMQNQPIEAQKNNNDNEANNPALKAPILKAKGNHHSPEMVTRRDGQASQGIFNENMLRKQNTGKSRKQVSISVQPETEDTKMNTSPQVGPKQDRNKKSLNKGDSNDSIQMLRLPGQKQMVSDFTVSSNENLGNDQQENDEGNSIISEEDSAFEDQTPMFQKKGKRNSQQMWEQRESKTIVKRPQVEDSKPQQIRAFNRQKTVGWKNQQDLNKQHQPFRRSPTNKSSVARQARQDSQESGNKTRFKMKIVDAKDIRNRSGSKYRHQHGVGGGSRHSSLNYMSDAMVDQLSMNFGKRYGQRHPHNENNMQDTNSVVSILTKGGTVVNPFNRDANNQQNRNLSIYHTNVSQSRQSRNQISHSQMLKDKHRQKMDVASGEHNIERTLKQRQASRTNVQFEPSLDESYSMRDLRNSLQFQNNNMIKVYLKTPYKVLSIRDVNKKLKNKNSGKDQQLFRAENLLQLHTDYRNQPHHHNQNHSTGVGLKNKFQRQRSLVGTDRVQQIVFANTKTSMLHQVSSQSQLSETKASALFDEGQLQQIKASQIQEGRMQPGTGIELDSQIPMNNSIYAADSQKITGAAHQRHQRHQKASIELEYKQQFFDSLREQIVRRINNLNFQTNIYKKQQKLYSIYGTSNFSKDAARDMNYTDLNHKNQQRIFEIIDRQSIQEVPADSSFRDQNFSISPDLTNYEMQNLKLMQLNVDSRDSLLPLEAQLLGARSFDNKNKNNSEVQPSEVEPSPFDSQQKPTEQSVNNEGNQNNQTMLSNENLHDRRIDDAVGPVRDQLRQLLDLSSTMNYPSNMQHELRRLEGELDLAERQLEVHIRRKDMHKYQLAKEAARSLSPGKLNLQHRESRPNMAKMQAKDERASYKNASAMISQPSSLGFQKSPPVRMDSYQDTVVKNKMNLQRKKELLDESSLERDRSLEQITTTNPGIKLNYSTIQDPNEGRTNHHDAANWRSIESSGDIKDYFENKISMRRSIDKKLHYDHNRSQVPNPHKQAMKKHQKILERKIFYQSQKMRQMTQNAMNQQVQSVSIYDGYGAVPAKATMSSMKEQVSSVLASKRQSNNGSTYTADMGSSTITPAKNQNAKHSRNYVGNGNTISHSKAYQNMLPMMPNVEDYMKNSPRMKKTQVVVKANQGKAHGSTHLPQIKVQQSTISQTYLNGQRSFKYNPMTDTNTRKSKKGLAIQNKQNVLQQDQSIVKSPRSSYADLIQDVSTLHREVPKSIEEEEDLQTHLEKNGLQLKKHSFKLEKIQTRKAQQQFSNSTQVQQNRISGNYSNNREPLQQSMPHLKEDRQMPRQDMRSKKGGNYATPASYTAVNEQMAQQATPSAIEQQKKLGFQYMNKSPKIIPPGALREFAYSNVELETGSPQKQQLNIDYMDQEYYNESTSHPITGKKTFESNYKTHNFPTIHQSGKIFATSGPAIVSPSHLQSLSQFKGKNFNKNAHLAKGVLSQQRRFSRIVSNRQNKKLKLNLSNSDLHQLFMNQQRGRNSMANSLPAKMQQINNTQEHYNHSALVRNENNTTIQMDFQSNNEHPLNDGDAPIASSSQMRINTHPATFQDQQDHLNGPVM